MLQGKKFQQKWEFRRRDNHINSSSDECRSGSSSEPVFKKHKSISDRKLSRIDKACDISRYQSKRRCSPGMTGNFEVEKSNKMRSGLQNKEGEPDYSKIDKRPSREDLMKYKNETHEPATVGSIQILMQSILDELELARENMFIWMREEMHKMMGNTAPKPTTKEEGIKHDRNGRQHQTHGGLVSNVRNSGQGTVAGSVKQRKPFDSQTSNGDLGNKVGCTQITGSTNLAQLEKAEALGLCIRKPPISVNPNHVGFSTQYTYLTLPTVLPETDVENQKFDYLSCHSFGMTDIGNRPAPTVIQASPAFDSRIHHGSFPGILQEDKIKRFVNPMGSPDMSHIAQNKLISSSNIGNGLTVPMHHNLNGAVKVQTGGCMHNLSQVQNILGLRMDGGMRSVGGSYGLSDFYVTNKLLGNDGNSRADDAWVQSNLITGAQRGAVIHDLDISHINS